jgi:hypothetical protein
VISANRAVKLSFHRSGRGLKSPFESSGVRFMAPSDFEDPAGYKPFL